MEKMNKTNNYTVEITSKHYLFNIDFKTLWKYKDLILLFVKRNFVSKYKQTILGPAWAIIEPLLTTIVFSVVFGGLAKLPTDGIPSFLFYLSGTICWQYFSKNVTETASTFIANAPIFGKVYFPRLVVPISTVITNVISYVIQLLLLLITMMIYVFAGFQIHPTLLVLLFPLLLLQMALLSLGVGMITSALTTRYRDLMMLISFGIQLWMYATPVAYSIELIPKKWMWLYMLNPMTPILETFRAGFLGINSFNLLYYLLSWVVTLLIMVVGLVLFNSVERNFIDTV